MTIVTSSRPYARRQLLAEIMAAFPELAPTVDPVTGEREAVLSFEHDGEGVTLVLPDTVDAEAVQAVLDAHVPQPPALDPEDLDQTRADQAKAQLRAYIANPAPTAVETVAVVKTLCRVALWSLRSRFRNGG